MWTVPILVVTSNVCASAEFDLLGIVHSATHCKHCVLHVCMNCLTPHPIHMCPCIILHRWHVNLLEPMLQQDVQHVTGPICAFQLPIVALKML